MENQRYILTGIDKSGRRIEITVKEHPGNIIINFFAYLYDIKIVTVYKAKLEFLESKEI